MELKFWNKKEVHAECFSKDALFSMVLLDVCKESALVFRQNYSNSAIILSDFRPSLDPTVIDTKGFVQHGYIGLERDILYFDPNTVNEFLRGSNFGLKVAGLKSLAIASREWTAVLILQKAFGQSAFPSLKHLTIVLNEIALQVEHIELGPKSNTFSLVTSPPTDDSTLMMATFDFELAKVSKAIFGRVNNYEGSIETATVIGRDSNCSWIFFASQESYLLARVAEGLLRETVKREKNINCTRERTIQQQQKVLQLNTETCRLIEASWTMTKRNTCLGDQVSRLMLVGIFLYIVALGCLLYSTQCVKGLFKLFKMFMNIHE